MFKEVNTFHSGRYSFSAETNIDLSVINECMNVFSRMPVFPDTVSQFKTDTMEKAIYNEVALEESSVTYSQVAEIIKHDRSNFSQDTNAIETINVLMAHNYIKKLPETSLTTDIITNIHKELITGLPNIKDIEGHYRKGGSKADQKWISVDYTPPASTLDINFLVKNLLEWIEDELEDVNPIIKAFLLHLHLKKIQPYFNANGKTARLVETWYLKNNNVRFLPYILPVVYNQNRAEYYKSVSDFYISSDISSFVAFVSKALKATVYEIRDKNFKAMSGIISAHYLNKLLDDKILIKRQYDFLCLIKDENLFFTHEDLQLKKQFTKLYGKVSRTTVSRDIKKFEELALIKSQSDGYVFNYGMVEI